MQSKVFLNWSDESFEWTWNNVPYTFPAGKAMYMEEYLCNHFAKHLVDRELLKQDKSTADHTRDQLIKKCFPSAEVIVEADPVKLAVVIENKNIASGAKRFCEQCDSKGVKHKKACPSLSVKEEEFPDLAQ